MGFFDRFKKKEHEAKPQTTNFDKEPLTLIHSDGRKDKIYFNGLVEIDGKQLMSVGIDTGVRIGDKEYRDNYYVDPIYDINEKGEPVDNTEVYYKRLAVLDRAAFNAVKGFFQSRDITKEKIGSNYIGKLVFNSQAGKYIRQYDEVFKQKYIEKLRQQERAEIDRKSQEAERARHAQDQMIAIGRKRQIQEELSTKTQDGTEYDMSHPRSGEAQILSSLGDLVNR